MNTTLTRVSIIIPNWNGLDLLKKHLPQIVSNAPGVSFILADDYSTDESVSYVRENFPHIRIVTSKYRRGFASTVNSGVAASSSHIVILLNTDIVPEKDFLKPLLKHFENPLVFAVGCMDKSMENGNVVLRGRGVGRWEKGFFIHERGDTDKTDTAWVSGGSGAFRTAMWKQLGGMDEIYNPFYWEDIDLSYRAKKHGWKILFERKSIVMHYHEKGKISSEFSPDYIRQIAFRNQCYFSWKNAPFDQFCLSFFWMPVRIFQALIKGDSIPLKAWFCALPYFFFACLKRIRG